MNPVYVDSSVIVAIMLEERGAKQFIRRLQHTDDIVSALLLEAEVLSVAKRCHIPLGDANSLIEQITLLMPERPLAPELDRLFACGYCRGADAFHLATALSLDPTGAELRFLTADKAQAALAARMGFSLVPA